MKKKLFKRIVENFNPIREATSDDPALERAYARFAQDIPGWRDSLFDWHFIAHHVTPILKEASEDTPETAAAQIAQAWARQWGFGSGLSERGGRRAMPAARTFLDELCTVRAELRSSHRGTLPEFCVPQVGMENTGRLTQA